MGSEPSKAKNTEPKAPPRASAAAKVSEFNSRGGERKRGAGRGSYNERGGPAYRGSNMDRGGRPTRGSHADRGGGRGTARGSHSDGAGEPSSRGERGRYAPRGSHQSNGETSFKEKQSHEGGNTFRGSSQERGRGGYRGRFKPRRGRGRGYVPPQRNTKESEDDDSGGESTELQDDDYPEEFGFLIKTYKSNLANGLSQIPDSLLNMEVSGFMLLNPPMSPYKPVTLRQVFLFLIEHPNAKPIKLTD